MLYTVHSGRRIEHHGLDLAGLHRLQKANCVGHIGVITGRSAKDSLTAWSSVKMSHCLGTALPQCGFQVGLIEDVIWNETLLLMCHLIDSGQALG